MKLKLAFGAAALAFACVGAAGHVFAESRSKVCTPRYELQVTEYLSVFRVDIYRVDSRCVWHPVHTYWDRVRY